MKNTTRLLFIISLCSILFASQCRKDTSPPAPPPEKYDYFACKVEGKAWKNCMPIGIYSSMSAQYFEGSYFDIEAKNYCDSVDSHIYIKVFGLNDTGTYILGEYSNNLGKYTFFTHGSVDVSFKTDSFNKGTIHIRKFDVPARKISGTFEFKAFNKDSNKVVTITEGQFINVYFYKF